MRQIAGGSQNGLKKFLLQYPSLFAIDGDYVNINTFPSRDKQTNKKDYADQAVEYFSEKLAQYGEGTEVPIRSLLGHRSQASPEVRHVSGQHFHEFREFLLKHSDSFLVSDENETVTLKNYDTIKSHTQELHFNPIINIDPEDTQTLLDFLAQCIEVKGPILVEQLFQIVSSNLPETMWSNLFNTSAHFSSFLRLFNDSFHIQANLVTLINHPKVNQKHINTQISNSEILNRENNSVQELKNAKNLSRSPEPEVQKFIEKTSTKTIGDRLRQPKLQVRTETKVEEVKEEPISKPVKNVNYNQTLKQRINTLVLKTLQENTGRDRQNLLNQSQNYADSWKVKLFQNTRVICSVRECQMVVEDIIGGCVVNESSWPFTEDKVVIGFDCEGINLGAKGQLTLMQIATLTGSIYVFDLISCPSMIEAGLRKVLESRDVVKIMHDCRNDSVNLYQQYDITLQSVFDTQAAHSVLTYQESGRAVYKAKSIALNALCEYYDAPVNPMKEQLKNIYRRDQKFWSRRPLSKEMILYASADVSSLVHENIYHPMRKAILEENRSLMMDLCYEQIFMYIAPEDIKSRKRQRKTGTEVAELRVKLSQPAKSIVLSNREVRLLRYIELSEDEKEKLKSSTKIAKKLEKLENNQDREAYSSEDDVDNDNEYPSLDSDALSPRNSEPTSLTESMQLMDSILNDNKIDRFVKIDKLEAILSAATHLPNENECCCNCHKISNASRSAYFNENVRILSPTNCYVSIQSNEDDYSHNANQCTSATQTLSTGDVVITKIYFNDAAE
ncbi:hypothetical protein FQR65_LT10820 [Abscondita terminalis]|nr:hypothetical protein FQR65_LT10820 [Abscondita terminalis]